MSASPWRGPGRRSRAPSSFLDHFRSEPCTRRCPRRVVEISGLPPDTLIRVTMGGEVCTLLTPPAPDAELRLLIGSCYYLPDDRGKLASAYDNLREQDRPHLRIHAGDQLYLDAGALPDGPTAFDRTHARYRQYWQEPSNARYLRGGLTLFTPDDHDFWNDYPYRMPHLTRSSDVAVDGARPRGAGTLRRLSRPGESRRAGRGSRSTWVSCRCSFSTRAQTGEPRRGIPPSASSTRRRARRCSSGARR